MFASRIAGDSFAEYRSHPPATGEPPVSAAFPHNPESTGPCVEGKQVHVTIRLPVIHLAIEGSQDGFSHALTISREHRRPGNAEPSLLQVGCSHARRIAFAVQPLPPCGREAAAGVLTDAFLPDTLSRPSQTADHEPQLPVPPELDGHA